MKNKHVKKYKALLLPPLINPFYRKTSESFMPLGLLSLAACLHHQKIPVQVYEPKIRLITKDDYKHAAKDILKCGPKIIGFSTWCITYPSSLLIAQEIKKIDSNILIVFGGPQASILPENTLKEFPYVDFILTGEADLKFPQFIKELYKQNPDLTVIGGLFYRNNEGRIEKNRTDEIISNLDELPIPAYDLVSKHDSIKLDIGRGCPFHCTYCSTNDFFSKEYRVKSVPRIIDEMLTCYKKYGTKSFGFAHDMFTLNKKFVFELCERLISLKKDKGIEFDWACSARIDCVTTDMLIKMKNAGCRSIFFGIESGSVKIQKSIQKNLKISEAYKIADLCRKIGLKMYASFIIGFPDETQEDVNETLQCMLKLALKGTLTQVSDLSLLPGTNLFNFHKNDLKFDGKFSNFSHAICGPLELNLIIEYPFIFSSFYYLAVKTLSRKEIIFLCQLLNQLRQFSNTLFLISNLIIKDTRNLNLLKIFKTEFKRISEGRYKNDIIDSHWIRIISNYLNKHQQRIEQPYIGDTFSYEAHVALLKTIYTSWHLVHPNKKKQVNSDGNFLIKPTPVWRTISTSYKLEKVIPSENNWENNTNKFRKGNYFYLLIAVSENRCKRIKLNTKEVFLLENLSELFFSEYVKKVKAVLSEKEILLWVRRMRRLGVLDISNK